MNSTSDTETTEKEEPAKYLVELELTQENVVKLLQAIADNRLEFRLKRISEVEPPAYVPSSWMVPQQYKFYTPTQPSPWTTDPSGTHITWTWKGGNTGVCIPERSWEGSAGVHATDPAATSAGAISDLAEALKPDPDGYFSEDDLYDTHLRTDEINVLVTEMRAARRKAASGE